MESPSMRQPLKSRAFKDAFIDKLFKTVRSALLREPVTLKALRLNQVSEVNKELNLPGVST